MATLNLAQLYVNVLTKQLVSVNGSPTSFPPLFAGDTPAFALSPVVPVSSNPNQGYTSIDLTGYTSNLTMADTPNATSPPTPFASLDGLTWTKPSTGFYYFAGVLDMTPAAVANFIGAAPSKTAYVNWDVFDSTLKRTTLFQGTFQLNASIDSPGTAPAGGSVVYPTLSQLYNIFLQIAPTPGKFVEWQDPDTGQKYLETVQNGVKTMTPIS